jgi:aldehyde dehydrogenase (NAD+)
MDILKELGIDASKPLSGTHDGQTWFTGGPTRDVISPVDDTKLATVIEATPEDLDACIGKAHDAFAAWRLVPAPLRGEIVRKWGQKLRDVKGPLGKLVSLEMGKSFQEGLGEVQEMIDICDFANGLSRQLYGNTMNSERPQHKLYEQWQPLGVVGVISAFNFPVAVYAWNAALALVCGDTLVWKPSEKTPLTAIAVQMTLSEILAEAGHPHAAALVLGTAEPIGEQMIHDKRIPLISATGSCRMGFRVGEVAAKRMARTILELGGNNAIIVSNKADLDLAVRGILFGAVGTSGQRCTTSRRIFLHKDIKDEFTSALVKAYGNITIGNPLDEANLMGPLIDQDAVAMYQNTVKAAKDAGAKLLTGGNPIPKLGKCYVEPTIFDASHIGFKEFELAQEETFAPILYLFEYENLDEAIAMQNDVRQGLSSAIFTLDLQESEQFLSAAGSDCGIANVNIGTSGAEIGGAFGGEKETGGGRESGSDSWKQYMRRQTTTVNWSSELPLSQGIKFDF